MDIVVGRFPPPLGGVSVFVQRKYAFVRASGGSRVDLGCSDWPFRVLRCALFSDGKFLLNTGNFFIFLFFYAFGLLPRTCIYDHNASRHYWGRGWRERFYLFVVNRAFEVRVVHQHLMDRYREKGFNGKVVVETPFLPPDESLRAEIQAGYKREVREFLAQMDARKVALSASKYALGADGVEIYGVRLFLFGLRALRSRGVAVKGLLAIADWKGDAEPSDLREEIQSLVADGLLVTMFGQNEFWPIYESLDCFLRLTSTDGDSVSVREALHYGCAVLASDVVPRPDGVSVCKADDENDFVAALMRVLTLSGKRVGFQEVQ